MRKSFPWSLFFGNLFEHYDTALFGSLSPFLAPLIFPEETPVTALLWTYGIFTFGMLARPLGSFIFGQIGDRYGRASALQITLIGMACMSGFIACIPLHAQIGYMSAILFCLARGFQSFFAGGEVMGGAIALLENTEEKKHDLLSSLYSGSTIGGALLASLGVYSISQYSYLDPGWRLLYGVGCITAFFGFWLRLSSPYTNKKEEAPTKLSSCIKPFVAVAITSGFSYATYSIAFVLINGVVPLISPLSAQEAMQMNSVLLFFDFLLLPFFGYLSSRFSREKVMLWASLSAVFLAIPLFSFLEGASLGTLLVVRIYLVITGIAFCAPFHAWAQNLIPPASRYTVLSLGYALGSQVLGSPTSMISLWLFQQTGLIASLSWYWIFLALASSFVLLRMHPAKTPLPFIK